jgi:hypothetical protein
MNVTKIFFFSLVSVPWTSAVSPDLNPDQQPALSPEKLHALRRGQQQENILWFEGLTDTQADWTLAYNQAVALDPDMPNILDTYFSDCVDYLGTRVYMELKRIHSAENHAERLPSWPHPYYELSKLVYLIRYSNIRILYNAKLALGPAAYHPLLAIIDAEHVAYVSTLFHDMRETRVPYESYMIDAAVLYSMNKAMLKIDPESELWSRLRFYGHMTKRLHRHLARFFRATADLQYFHNVETLEFRINQVKEFSYEDLDIQAMVEQLAHQILYVIVIYGSHSMVGSRLLSTLLEHHQAVRRILHVDTLAYSTVRMFCHELLSILSWRLENIRNEFEEGHPWFHRLVQMVKNILESGG